MKIFQLKIDFLSANSRFAFQNDGTYQPRITRETCVLLLNYNAAVLKLVKQLSFFKNSFQFLSNNFKKPFYELNSTVKIRQAKR